MKGRVGGGGERGKGIQCGGRERRRRGRLGILGAGHRGRVGGRVGSCQSRFRQQFR